MKRENANGQFIASLLRASRKILELHEFNDTARHIFDSCKELIGATAGYVALLSEDGTENEVLFLESGGVSCRVDPALPMPIRGLRAEAYRTTGAVFDNDFTGSRWVQYLPVGHVELRNVLFAPLVIEGKAVGLLGLANKPDNFTDNDAATATAFAELAALALLNSRTLGQISSSEKKYRDLVNNALVGVYRSTIGGEILYANNALLAIVGVDSLPELKSGGLSPRWYKNPAHREIMIETLLRKGKVEGFETELVTRTGEVKSVVISAVRDEDALSGMVMDISSRKRAEQELLRRHSELSVLHKVSSAISTTIDINELFHTILETITSIELFGIERKGGILLVKGESLDLISHLGHSDEFLALHRDLKTGDCLCGLAARTGKLIVSKDSCDEHHTIRYPGMTPHGHIIVPLKAKERVVGVLYLYVPAGSEIDEDKIAILNSIGNQIGVAIENAQLYEETRKLSCHDPLTGLANRRLLDVVFEGEIASAKRTGASFSVLMIDIDYFKRYNDTHGHLAGDALLVKISAVLTREVRGVDLVVRYGGEEFLVLLSGTGPPTALEVAERVRDRVEKEVRVGISIGISAYSMGITQKELIAQADSALYLAKQRGRNRVEAAWQP